MIKKIVIVVTIISAVYALSGCSKSLGDKVTLRESLKYDDISKISVDISSAETIIIPEDRNDILVEFDTYENGDKLKTKEGSKTLIETYNDNSISFNMNTDYQLRIYLPEEYDKDFLFDLSSGSVTMRDMTLDQLSYELSSGNINGSNITSKNITLDLSSGDVKLDKVSTESIDIEMSSGNVSLNDFTGEIKGSSSSGTFEVSYANEMNALDFNASSGNIKIDYSDVDVNGDFKLTKSSGNIKVAYDLDDYRSTDDGDKITGTLGSGEYPVTLDISSGNIKIN